MSENLNRIRTLPGIPGYVAGTWRADPTTSEIAVSVRQLLVTTVRGRFTGYDVTIVTGDDPLRSSVVATLDPASLDTGNPKRDEHLASATFLEVAKYPTSTYRSTGLRRADEGWIVDGQLTMHGISRAVPVTVTGARFDPDAEGGPRAHFSASARLKRSDFNVDRWTGGGVVVGDTVAIALEIDAVPQT
jgi:polyisoprenoid-binding protein YceI